MTGCDIILQHRWRKYENTKRYTSMNNTEALTVTKGKIESRAGGLEGQGLRQSADDPRVRYTSLISNRENLQALNSGI